MTGLAYGATLVTAAGSGVAAGVFFAFSSFVMPALRRVPAREGVMAMQSINERAPTFAFMTALFGTAAAAAGLAVWAVVGDDGVPRGWLLAGAAAYLAGTIGVTMAGNVPLNNRLVGFDPSRTTPEAWDGWAARWTALNHVRTVAAVAAAVAFIVALERG